MELLQATPEWVIRKASHRCANMDYDLDRGKRKTGVCFGQINVTYARMPEFLKGHAETSLLLVRKLA